MTNGTDLNRRAEQTTWVGDVLSATTFDVVVRGYDRRQVDVYLEYIETLLAEYQEDITELGEACSRLLREYKQPSYEGLGRRVRVLLQLAEEEATAITTAAGQEAEAVRAAANRDVEQIHADLDRQRTELTTMLTKLRALLTTIPDIDPDRPTEITFTPRDPDRPERPLDAVFS